MRPRPLVALVVAVAALVLWREHRLAADLESLRAAIAARPDPVPAAPVRVESPAQAATPKRDDPLPDLVLARIEVLEERQADTLESLTEAIDALNRLLAEKEKASRRAWGPEQMLGEPDTFTAGDHTSAWAAMQPDAGPEWLQLGFERPVEIARVLVRETDKPGAVTRVTAILDDGREITLWQGNESAGPAPFDSPFPAPPGIVARNVKVYLDTRRFPGWEEIDAVALIGRDGTRQWANAANSSSTYAARGAGSVSGGTLQFGTGTFQSGASAGNR